MKAIKLTLAVCVAGFLTCAVASAESSTPSVEAAASQSGQPAVTGDRLERRREARELRHDRSGLRHERREVRQGRRELHRDRAELRQDRRELRRDRRAGNRDEVADGRRELREGRREIAGDRRELRADHAQDILARHHFAIGHGGCNGNARAS